MTSYDVASTMYESPPAGATCGTFSAARTQVARDILTCNQDNWRDNCLAHYSDSLVGRSKLKPVETRVQSTQFQRLSSNVMKCFQL